jgi:hypothetical protein
MLTNPYFVYRGNVELPFLIDLTLPTTSLRPGAAPTTTTNMHNSSSHNIIAGAGNLGSNINNKPAETATTTGSSASAAPSSAATSAISAIMFLPSLLVSPLFGANSASASGAGTTTSSGLTSPVTPAEQLQQQQQQAAASGRLTINTAGMHDEENLGNPLRLHTQSPAPSTFSTNTNAPNLATSLHEWVESFEGINFSIRHKVVVSVSRSWYESSSSASKLFRLYKVLRPTLQQLQEPGND